MRLLCNAEPFGFGPTAAIAAIMPEVKPFCTYIGYAGKGHTLDLQRSLPYDAIHGEDDVLWSAYDTFLTALDFGMAHRALQNGLKVAIYDPLTWYWPCLDPCIAQSLYLAQAFYGVTERLAQAAGQVGQVRVVPPLVSLRPSQTHRKGVLINLGGLQNPFWPVRRVQAYALALAQAIRRVVPVTEPITLTTSEDVARFLQPHVPGVAVGSLPHHTMQDVMSGYRVAFMTPGLGNMYDAAAHALPTIWLPPANDSQGQQLDLLRQHGHADGAVDWADVGLPITYADAQPKVMAQIAEAIGQLPQVGHRLQAALADAWAGLDTQRPARIHGLVTTFGHDGARHVAQALQQRGMERKDQ